ncbi:MAG TPA: STAS domain-containing protein [Acidimicrobiales bacterium]|nr:STAS domain-containing protein [Acidimicrobiales bacterium]
MAWLHLDEFLDLDLEVGTDGAPTVVSVIGELDAAACPTAQAVSERTLAEATPVVLDMSSVTFFSAAGITMLLALQDRAAAVGTELTLRDPHPIVIRLLDIAGVASRFQLDQLPAPGGI